MKIESKYLVSTEWLDNNLDDRNIVLIEANAKLPNYFEKSAEKGVRTESGRDEYLKDHLPGADFIDLLHELSDPEGSEQQSLPLLSEEKFSEVMSRHGISDGVKVVVYDRSVGIWACRFWLMLRSYGFENVAVLDGGYTKWVSEGRKVEVDIPQIIPRSFVTKEFRSMFSSKEDVLEAMGNERMGLVNALSPEEFAGHDIVRYGRPGHIPSSVNIHSRVLMNMETFEFKELEALEEIFRAAGVYEKDRVICYCGGAVGASSGVFLMTILGVCDATLYNGSLKEWAADHSLPLNVLERVSS